METKRERRCPTRGIARPSGARPNPPLPGAAGCRLPGSPGVPCPAWRSVRPAGAHFCECESLEPRRA
eukprot:6024133-Heterocapsa_arctica.AAC.1